MINFQERGRSHFCALRNRKRRRKKKKRRRRKRRSRRITDTPGISSSD